MSDYQEGTGKGLNICIFFLDISVQVCHSPNMCSPVSTNRYCSSPVLILGIFRLWVGEVHKHRLELAPALGFNLITVYACALACKKPFCLKLV